MTDAASRLAALRAQGRRPQLMSGKERAQRLGRWDMWLQLDDVSQWAQREKSNWEAPQEWRDVHYRLVRDLDAVMAMVEGET